MVRVTVSKWHTPLDAYAYRYTAVDLPADDPTPGVYPMLLEVAHMKRPDVKTPFDLVLQKIVARNDDDARDVSASVYDAARGFLALGIAPNPQDKTALQDAYRLTIEIGDDRWSFPTTQVPAEGWAVLRAAERMMDARSRAAA
jgi:hypothetical protein